MSPLNVEVYSSQRQQWAPICTLNAEDPAGSFSDNTVSGRDIYVFGVDPIEDQAYIKRSLGGIVIEESDMRRVESVGGLVLVATLQANESHEMVLRTDRSAAPRRVRFTFVALPDNT